MAHLTLPKRLLVFDLDGVIYRGDTPTPGVPQVPSRLQQQGFHLHYLTNNSSRSRDSYCRKLTAMGLSVSPEQVMTSAHATALYLAQEGFKDRPVLVVGEGGLVEELRAAGIAAIPSGESHAGEPVDAVVVGIDRQFTYQRLLQAQQAIVHGARFIATNLDATFPTEQGIIPGGGSIAAAITTSCSQQPFVVGKPNVYSLELILEAHGIPAAQALLIGDRLDTDIDVGRRAGLETILTLTGVTSREALAAAPPSQHPTVVIENLWELEPLLE